MWVNYRNKQILKMGHWGPSASETVLYIKRTSDLGYLGLPAGWRPVLLLLVYFCCLEASIFYFGAR